MLLRESTFEKHSPYFADPWILVCCEGNSSLGCCPSEPPNASRSRRTEGNFFQIIRKASTTTKIVDWKQKGNSNFIEDITIQLKAIFGLTKHPFLRRDAFDQS